MPTKSPCFDCQLKDQPKNTPECKNCDKRIEYVNSITGKVFPEIKSISKAAALYFEKTNIKFLKNHTEIKPKQVFAPINPTTKNPYFEINTDGWNGEWAVGVPVKTCKTCGISKPLTKQFWHIDQSRKNGFAQYCSECRSKNRKIYYESKKSDCVLDYTFKPDEKENIMSIDEKSSYYDAGGIETIEIIKAKLTPEQFRGYLLGNMIKYSCRINHKGAALRDAEKVRIYAGWFYDAIQESDNAK
jgi:hypothetical protein